MGKNNDAIDTAIQEINKVNPLKLYTVDQVINILQTVKKHLNRDYVSKSELIEYIEGRYKID